jgi:uncharacterized integral membrane protein
VSAKKEQGGGRSVKSVVIGVLVVALLVVIFQNTADTRLHILFFDVTWPLWLLLSVFAAVAFTAGWFAGRMRG